MKRGCCDMLLIARTLFWRDSAAMIDFRQSSLTSTFIWGKPQEPTTATLPNIFPYKLGADTRSTLINNMYVVNSLSKDVPNEMEMSDIDLLRFALAHPHNELSRERHSATQVELQ